ncbi:MAG: hypothetical protein NC184_01955 [Roseburia sp.]|nr:hypothetical protein [Roseburia sp.]
MITIIFAPPRTGKTALLTAIAYKTAYDKDRNRAMRRELLQKQASGFANITTIPEHCVSANYDMVFRRFGYYPRYTRRINPYRLGFANAYVDTHFNLPYECICITEAQKYLNSRRNANYPDWQSRWYEQHGHNWLDIYLDTQRVGLIDLNVRELAQFIEVVKLVIAGYDRWNRPCRFVWTLRHMDNLQQYEAYCSSGKRDTSCYTESEFVVDAPIFDFYDSYSCKPKFYKGHLDSDIDYSAAELTEDNFDGYIKWLSDFDDELPDGFYKKEQKR